MRPIKGLTTIAVALSLLALPAGALAKRGDRDRDRMPDRWEKRHHLNTRAKDARRDADNDGLSNLSEFRRHTDPRDADSDDDGIRDGDEVRNHTSPRLHDSDDDGVDDEDELSGTVDSFTGGVLTIRLAAEDAGTASGAVTDATVIECDDDDDRTATTSESGSGSDGDDDDDGRCAVADLTRGARVHEAKLVKAADGSMVFTKIELVPAA